MDLQTWNDTQYAREQAQKLVSYRRLNRFARKGQIVLAGSSLMEFFPVNELAQSLGLPYCIYNRGIAGYVSAQMREALAVQVLELEPSKVFLNIGTNDLGQNLDDQLWENYPAILQEIQAALPQCRIISESTATTLVCRSKFRPICSAFGRRRRLLEANRKVEALAQRFHCRYIDVNRGLCDQSGLLQASYATDGVHFYPDGYMPGFGKPPALSGGITPLSKPKRGPTRNRTSQERTPCARNELPPDCADSTNLEQFR